VARREADVVLAYSLTRLGRRVRDLLELSDFLRANDCALAVVDQSLDTSTAVGQVFYTICAALAQMESEQISERVKSATRLAAQQGKRHPGGNRQFGYNQPRRGPDGEPIVTPDPSAEPWGVHEPEAGVIREMASRVLGGESLRSLAAELNRRDVTTTTGRPWSPGTLGQMLRSPLIAGIRAHRPKTDGVGRGRVSPEFHDGDWEPILDRGAWAAVRAELDSRKASGPPTVRAHLLTGLLVCGRCGSNMRAHRSAVPGRKPMNVYQCMRRVGEGEACGRMSISKPSADEAVANMFLDFVSRVRLRQADEGEMAGAEAELARTEATVARLANDYYVEGVAMPEEVFRATMADLRARAESLRASRDAAAAAGAARAGALPPGDRGALQGWWDEAGANERREALRRAVDRVVVSPAERRGNVFDPGRLHVAWTFAVYVAGTEAGVFPEESGIAVDEFLNEYGVEILPSQ